MSILDFTVEETNLVAIYKATTAAATISNISDIRPLLGSDMREIAGSCVRKLAALTEPEFAALLFTYTDDTDSTE